MYILIDMKEVYANLHLRAALADGLVRLLPPHCAKTSKPRCSDHLTRCLWAKTEKSATNHSDVVGSVLIWLEVRLG